MKINKACDLSFFSILPPTPGSFLRSLLRSAISVSLIFFNAQTRESSPSEWSFLWLRICDYMCHMIFVFLWFESLLIAQLFQFGDKYRGKYDASVGVVKSYYASMRKATVKEEYFEYIISKARSFGGIGWAITEFSWDVKYDSLQVIASKVEERMEKDVGV